jgi:nucleoid-associated protein YgaU
MVVLALVAVLGFLALSAARPTSGAGAETRYVVQPGDTLWEIASTRYGGDPREAVWRIRERNGLPTSTIAPGTVLRLP